MKDCKGGVKEKTVEFDGIAPKNVEEQKYIYVRLHVLREYLERELAMPNLPFPYEFERVNDDWTFLNAFIGSDFLPHLSSLEIREDAIDRIVRLYKETVFEMKRWLTHDGQLDQKVFLRLMQKLAVEEVKIFKNRQQALEPEAGPSNYQASGSQRGIKRKVEQEEGDGLANDDARLGEEGFEARYYQSKFGVGPDDLDEFRARVATEYLRGLCWVWLYYFQVRCPPVPSRSRSSR